MKQAASVARALAGVLVGGLAFAAGMLVVLLLSPFYGSVDPRSVFGIEFILATVAAGLFAGTITSVTAGRFGAAAVVLLAVGVFSSGLLIIPRDWELQQFTTVFLAPVAVALGGAVSRRRRRAVAPIR